MNVHPLTGFWPFRSERPFGFSTPFCCKAPLNGFLTVSQWEAFWVFDIVSLRVRRFGFLTSFHQMRSFYVFKVFCSVYTITGFNTLLRFWGRLRRLDHHEFFDLYEYFNYPFEFLTSFMAFRPLRVVWPSRLFRPFCVFDIVSYVRPLLSSI